MKAHVWTFTSGPNDTSTMSKNMQKFIDRFDSSTVTDVVTETRICTAPLEEDQTIVCTVTVKCE